MLPLEWRLRQLGHHVITWTYSSLRGTVREHGERLREYLKVQLAGEERIDIVAHSMGSILVRHALAETEISNLGRVVFLTPPNLGSPVARYVSRLIGNTIRTIGDISDARDSFVNRLPAWSKPELAVVASRFDVLVPLANTHLGSATAHRIVNHTHNSILFSGSVAQDIERFLNTGSLADQPAS